jgi:hypothetical protein
MGRVLRAAKSKSGGKRSATCRSIIGTYADFNSSRGFSAATRTSWRIIMKSRKAFIAAAVITTFAAGASGVYLNASGGVPSLAFSHQQDEGTPHNLITALKADEGVPHNLVTEQLQSDEGVADDLRAIRQAPSQWAQFVDME